MAKPKLKADTSFIKPLIEMSGETHVLKKQMEEDPEEMPEMKSIGYAKIGGARHSWVSYVITTKGDKVLSMEVAEPDMREIAEEAAKINFVQNFSDQELL